MNLDNLAEIRKLDSENMLGSLELLNKQAEQVWNTAKKMKVPASYKNAKNLVVLGMGGSAIGTHLVKTLFASELRLPVEICNDYHIPAFIDKDSLVVGSSYSGSTEETVAALTEAKKRKAKLLVISAGGKLADFAKKNKIPALIFSTENNPCGSPRMGLGYSIIGQLMLYVKTGLLKLSDAKIKQMIKTLGQYDNEFGVENKIEMNPAKQLALKTIDKSVLYTASEHLLGNAHIAANQMNENGKRFAAYFAIPELNHHLMEGMVNPTSNKENLFFIFFQSHLYYSRIQKRYEVTKEVLKKNSIQFESYHCREKDKIFQACEVLVLGAYISYYSALLKGIDPTPIPYVDFFKEQMK
jgi:glucose/mannose-6-phosphate isomerase